MVKGYRPRSAEGRSTSDSTQERADATFQVSSSRIVRVALVTCHCWERPHAWSIASRGFWGRLVT